MRTDLPFFSKTAIIEKNIDELLTDRATRSMSKDALAKLPPSQELETPRVLRALVNAHRHLAELKGVAKAIPNEGILISTLSLQEAQSSSEIENIITTQDALYKEELQTAISDPVAKEVAHYATALRSGYDKVKNQKVLSLNTILEVQETLEGNRAGFRKTPGTVLKNEQTGEIVFEPPSPERIGKYMSDLEQFINTEQVLDPLVCMALIHHQFETIHPFYDGNGRTGRIINILYLVLSGLLDTPVLYLSRYINQTKSEYYTKLQHVRDSKEWEAWLLYMLRGISSTASHTIGLIQEIQQLLLETKQEIRSNHKFYSQDLINNLFRHPYTKVAFLERDLDVSRATATRYLDALSQQGSLTKHRHGKESYYINHKLIDLLFNMPEFP
ncbi:Fic family protein [Pseudomaricurvus alkylphenolicus]|uniref:Fic family protein n=1 Tax=Pseudomaricurvus alkylphenolicus TaxID=1306991 RepID=UPI001F0FF644|nr:Fic family protein [Pseudomaricurvus alkylphenolicus]